MKVLIIDDNLFKTQKISQSILNVFPDAEISSEKNFEDSKWNLLENDYDLLCLDWEFPSHEGGSIELNGKRILELIENYDFDTPVIICSSAKIQPEDVLCKNVKCHVYFRPLDPDMDPFETALKQCNLN